MKTMTNLARTGLLLAVLGLTPLFGTARAEQKGAERLLQLNQVATTRNLQPAKPGDALSMTCPKCKDKTTAVVEQTFKTGHPREIRSVTTHLCNGCDTKTVTLGQGKTQTSQVVHTCTESSRQVASCCAMTKVTAPASGTDDAKSNVH
jgi:hypothetical protein